MVDGVLVDRVRATVEPRTAVITAIAAFRGPRPGLEVLAFVPAFLFVQLLPIDGLALSALAGAVAGVVAFLIVAALRTYVTIARTDTEILVVRNAALRSRQPRVVEERHPLGGATRVSSDDGGRLVIGAHTYWVAGRSRDEVRHTISPAA